MRRFTDKQKRELRARALFWGAHALHWWVAALFLVITFATLYTFWGNDAAFASMVLSR
ncbi:MAG TPA: hypothetical protein VN397_01820 [Candidatus Methylomirabilis sp.]|nr:hypothetical protein [Candidatus Methylomirabilis sp.]